MASVCAAAVRVAVLRNELDGEEVGHGWNLAGKALRWITSDARRRAPEGALSFESLPR